MNRINYFILGSFLLLSMCNEKDIDIIPYDSNHFQEACDITAEINDGFEILNYQGTKQATSDKKAGTCWNIDKPNHNVWFKFLATSTKSISIIVSLDISRSDSQKRTLLALWEKDGVTELTCSKYINDDDDVTLSYTSLTEGEWYYFSVDVQDSDSRGTFFLEIYDYL